MVNKNMQDGIVSYHGCLPRITSDFVTDGSIYKDKIDINDTNYDLVISPNNIQIYTKVVNNNNTTFRSVLYIDMIDMDLIYNTNTDIDSIFDYMENHNVCLDNIPIKEYLKKLELYSDSDNTSDIENGKPKIVFTEIEYVVIDNNPLRSYAKFVYDCKFGEFYVNVIDSKIQCYVALEERSAKWTYHGDVMHTDFYDSEYVSEFKNELCSQVFPYGLPVVLRDGTYSK